MARNNDYRRQTISGILRDYGERAKQAAIEALLENADMVVEEAKSRCPVKTGKLRESIHPERKGENKVRIVADAQNEKNGYYYGRLIEYSPNGQPFLHPALNAKRDEIKQHTIDKIRAAINQS